MPTIVIRAAPNSRTAQLLVGLAEAREHAVRWAPALGVAGAESGQVWGADAIVLIPTGARSAHEMTHRVREQACRWAPDAHLLLVSSFAVGHGPRHRLGCLTGALPDLAHAERALRAGSAPYTIVRPTWLTDDPAGAHAITLTQDPRADGMLARADLATALLAAIEQPCSRGRTFALFNEPGEPPRDWAALFAALTPGIEVSAA